MRHKSSASKQSSSLQFFAYDSNRTVINITFDRSKIYKVRRMNIKSIHVVFFHLRRELLLGILCDGFYRSPMRTAAEYLENLSPDFRCIAGSQPNPARDRNMCAYS